MTIFIKGLKLTDFSIGKEINLSDSLKEMKESLADNGGLKDRNLPAVGSTTEGTIFINI